MKKTAFFSVREMHLTVLKRPLVRFSDVHGGYLEGATLTFNVEYEPELEVTSQDWVAIIPAGSNDLRQFVSFQVILHRFFLFATNKCKTFRAALCTSNLVEMPL